MLRYRINRVLVPTDFSDVANNALQTAIAVCKRQLASLTLIHVIENSYFLFQPEAGGAAGSVLPRLIQDANENLASLARELRLEHDLVVDYVVRSGNPADEICALAFHRSTDLIIMGTHGASGLREFLVGSNAYRVVKNASCPVMTIPGHHQWLDFKKILFPVRMIPQALDKYEYVHPIIRMNGSSVMIAGIVKRTNPDGLVEMQALVDSFRKKTAGDNVMCSSEVHYTENVARQVLNISEQEKPDLVVITATLDTTVRDFFLGPYTQDIVNHSKFPVLSIRPGEDAAKEQVGMSAWHTATAMI